MGYIGEYIDGENIKSEVYCIAVVSDRRGLHIHNLLVN